MNQRTSTIRQKGNGAMSPEPTSADADPKTASDRLRHHLARRRAVAGRLDDRAREAADRRAARADGRRRHRGRLRDRLAGRLPGGPRGRQADQGQHRLLARRAPAATTSTAPPRRCSRPAQKRIHTFIATSPLHMRVKLQKTPEEVHQAVIDSVTHARRLRRRRVVVRGRLALGARLPLPLHRERDRLPAPPRSTSRTRWATPTPTSSPT